MLYAVHVLDSFARISNCYLIYTCTTQVKRSEVCRYLYKTIVNWKPTAIVINLLPDRNSVELRQVGVDLLESIVIFLNIIHIVALLKYLLNSLKPDLRTHGSQLVKTYRNTCKKKKKKSTHRTNGI